MMSRIIRISLAAAAALAAVAVFAEPMTIELPPETATFKPGPGVEVANAQCLVCHSAEYVSTQSPNRPRSYWEGVVVKMKKVFGAQIPDDQIKPIVDYLTRTYGSE